MLSQTFTFTVPGGASQWRLGVVVHANFRTETLRLTRDGAEVWEITRPLTTDLLRTPVTFAVEGLDIEVGALNALKYGLVVRKDGEVVWRSSDKPFRSPGLYDRILTRLGADKEDEDVSPEDAEWAERQKALRPSLYVDLAFGVMFFLVAREFGLVTAALTGAGATFALFLVNPFVRWDLLGGFAAFGAVMALISAGLAWGFQDDLAIKLRGTVMALIGMAVALFDALVLKGGYLGQRLALYMEWIGELDPKRASLALAGATLVIMLIDTPLAFILTTDQWIWYNAFLDGLIAMPILLGSIYLFARIDPDCDPDTPSEAE